MILMLGKSSFWQSHSGTWNAILRRSCSTFWRSADQQALGVWKQLGSCRGSGGANFTEHDRALPATVDFGGLRPRARPYSDFWGVSQINGNGWLAEGELSICKHYLDPPSPSEKKLCFLNKRETRKTTRKARVFLFAEELNLWRKRAKKERKIAKRKRQWDPKSKDSRVRVAIIHDSWTVLQGTLRETIANCRRVSAVKNQKR